MKLRTEIDPTSAGEIILRIPEMTPENAALLDRLTKLAAGSGEISVYNGEKEFYLPVRDLLFFEMYDGHVYAHTPSDCYQCDARLCELRDLLPKTFVRASKSALINTARIFCMTRSITGVAVAEFYGTKKKCSVSRMYYHEVRETIEETRLGK